MKLFDFDNPVWSACSKVFDLILLNIIFILCCIPVITIGPAITALYYTTLRMTSGRLSYVAAEFWKSFKENLKQGMLTGIIVFDVGVMLAVGTYFSFWVNAYFGKVLFVVLDVMAVTVALYTFPMLAKFQTTTAQLFRNSALMAVKYLPVTVLQTGIWFLAGYFACNLYLAGAIMLFIGFAGIATIQSFWLNYLFSNFTSQEEKEKDLEYQREAALAKQEKRRK